MKIMLREYRKGLKLSQKCLALKVGVSRIYISRIENNKCIPSLGLLIRIADVFNICPLDLIDFCDICKKCCKGNCKKYFF